VTGATRRLAESIEAVTGAAEAIEPMTSSDSLSGSRLERRMAGGLPYVVKYLSRGDDWVMRATGDLGFRPIQVWRSGLMDRLPPCIDTAMIGCVGVPPALVLRDVGHWMVPPGSDPIPIEQHLRFMDHMAALHAAFWETGDDAIDLTPMSSRCLWLSPLTAQTDRRIGPLHPTVAAIEWGWEMLERAAPRLAPLVRPIQRDPFALVDALAETPSTFIHGDWKLGNLGSLPDGRTVLLDWAVPGRGPACADLVWYLAVNCDRLPHPKEDAIAAYRRALEAHGVVTTDWWDRQLALSLIAGFLQLGWSKTGAGGAELRWWEDRVLEGVRLIH
jgi:hypothetical protein